MMLYNNNSVQLVVVAIVLLCVRLSVRLIGWPICVIKAINFQRKMHVWLFGTDDKHWWNA